MIFVPDLKGKYFEQTSSVTGLHFEVDKYVNSDEFEKGQIISHVPEYGAQVQQGTVIKVTISLGPEPEVKTMSYLIGYQETEARSVLTSLGMVPVAMEEFNDVVEKGKVSRTDPEAGTPLSEGQTVYIYISKGPVIETAEMPQLIGMGYEEAKKTLVDLGFSEANVSYERKESKEDRDEVIGQPYPKGEKVDVTSKIVLTISKGSKNDANQNGGSSGGNNSDDGLPVFPDATPNGTPNSSQSSGNNQSSGDPNQTRTKEVVIYLPTNRAEQYLLGLYHNGMQVIEDTIVSPDRTQLSVVLTGTGVQSYDVYINNQFYNTIKVDFSANG